MPIQHRFFKILSAIAVLAMVFSNLQPLSVQAQGQGGDGLKRQVNAENGRLSFLGTENGLPLPAAKALGTSRRPENPGLALAKRFAPEFGVKNPERDLSEMKSHRTEDGRLMVRYQQQYQAVPVMGGELIVNTNDSGDLYSMNGEVSQDLSLSTQPAIDANQAREIALQTMMKWYHKGQGAFVVSEPQLWIYDESLLQQSTRPAELVWRMEVTSKNDVLPVRELVLVNAQRGDISLHFNQIDTAWNSSAVRTGTIANNSVVSSSTSLNQSSVATLPETIGSTTWYVATTGDDANSCTTTASPCKTINAVLGKAGFVPDDTIFIAAGTYNGGGNEVVLLNKNVRLSGGWDSAFTTQNGWSVIDGEGVRLAMSVVEVSATIERFIFQNGYSFSSGGGIYNGGTLVLNNSIVQNNICCNDLGTIDGGGGISNWNTLTVNNSVIRDNISFDQGGGIYNNYYSTLILNNTTVSGNEASTGAGISSYRMVTINNSTISGNWAIKGQSGVGYAGGIYFDNGYGGTFTIKNSIVAGNWAAASGPDCKTWGSITSAGYNLLGNNSDCSFNSTTGDKVGTSGSPINPRLTPLQDNSGPTFTHALINGSPAIDAGNPATCLSTDQRGVARPVGAKCDIGAYEGSIAWAPPYRLQTYTTNNTSSLPGTFLCDQTDPNCMPGDLDAKLAHKYAIGTYTLYANKYARNSIDGKGMIIKSTVHYCAPDETCPYANANWTGTQMVYGDAYGFAQADDVVAHELTHGVTQYESNLFYVYQSGAINESFSDLWGEYFDQTNGQGLDVPYVKWLIGEDVYGLSAIRSMSNPPAYNDPDKMSSPYYHKVPYDDDNWDNGGVHTNSGINNKAAFLMVDGGSFNGKTITGLGWDKVGAIYYEVNTNLLTSGADYSDLYYALQQACNNLIGQKGITGLDCAQVRNTVDAVELNSQPGSNFNTDAPVCDVGKAPTMILADDLENGTGKWTFTKTGTDPRWQLDSTYWDPYAQSGSHSLYADDYPAVATDASARLIAVAIPANAYLWFAQSYEFETYTSGDYAGQYFDGGVLEYSTNGGSSWIDAGSLIQYNGYKGKLYDLPDDDNPLHGRWAFVGSSHGYISTRLNLASLAGYTVSFRWRMGLDTYTSYRGWWVDNVKIYTCPTIAKPVISGNAGAAGVTLSYTDGTPKSVISDAKGNYSLQVTSGWTGTITPSHPCYTFTPANLPYSNVIDNKLWQNFTPIYNPGSGCPQVNVDVGSTFQGQYIVPIHGSVRQAYNSLDNGPVKISSSNASPILASERFIYSFQNSKSYAEMMGYPGDQLATEYWFTWYNNLSYSTQLRVSNMGSNSAEVKVYAGNSLIDTITLSAGQGARKSYAGLDSGPLHVVSTDGVTPILASERFIQTFMSSASYAEMMGYPGDQLATEYWFPWYNNLSYSTQLRVSNLGGGDAEIKVYAGSGIDPIDTFTLGAGQGARKSYSIDNGPLHVVSTDGVTPILASERFIYTYGTSASYAEMMGYPNDQLTTEYCFPWYNTTGDAGVGVSSQLRVSNMSANDIQINVTLAGTQIDSFPLSGGQGSRKTYLNRNSGPLCVKSTDGVTSILASERFISTYLNSASYSEILGYPTNKLASSYWFPWYNNVSYSTELRMAKP